MFIKRTVAETTPLENSSSFLDKIKDSTSQDFRDKTQAAQKAALEREEARSARIAAMMKSNQGV
jgi:hypothetical protein